MTRIDGLEPLPAPAAAAAARLFDAGWVARALPGAEVIAAAPDRAEWRIRPNLPFLTGALDSVAEVVTRDGATAAAYRIRAKAVGSGSTIDVALSVREAPAGGCEVAWSATVGELSGLLRLAPKAMVEATAKKVIADVWIALRAGLATG